MKHLIAAVALATAAVTTSPATAKDAQPVYVIATITVTDFDSYMTNYASTAIPLILEAGGEILVGAPEVEVLEGDYGSNWTVVVKFPDENAARSWYDNPDYQAVIPNRIAASDTDASALIIAPQFQPPG